MQSLAGQLQVNALRSDGELERNGLVSLCHRSTHSHGSNAEEHIHMQNWSPVLNVRFDFHYYISMNVDFQ